MPSINLDRRSSPHATSTDHQGTRFSIDLVQLTASTHHRALHWTGDQAAHAGTSIVVVRLRCHRRVEPVMILDVAIDEGRSRRAQRLWSAQARRKADVRRLGLLPRHELQRKRSGRSRAGRDAYFWTIGLLRENGFVVIKGRQRLCNRRVLVDRRGNAWLVRVELI